MTLARVWIVAMALEWFRTTVRERELPPAGVEPPLQALWYAAKTQFAEDDLVDIFERIGGNDGTPEDAGPPGSPGWHWTTGHMICQTVEYGYNPRGLPDQPPNDPDLSWVHAHFHRLESDAQNATGWYGRAEQEPRTDALEEEWSAIAGALLSKSAVSVPRLYLLQHGLQDVTHSRALAGSDIASGSFLVHLHDTEDILRGWECDEATCLAGLYHSIYVRRRHPSPILSVSLAIVLTRCAARVVRARRGSKASPYPSASGSRCAISSARGRSASPTSTASWSGPPSTP